MPQIKIKKKKNLIFENFRGPFYDDVIHTDDPYNMSLIYDQTENQC